MIPYDEEYDPPDCVLKYPKTEEEVDQVHSFFEGKCELCGWKQDAILSHRNFRPWDGEWDFPIRKGGERGCSDRI